MSELRDGGDVKDKTQRDISPKSELMFEVELLEWVFCPLVAVQRLLQEGQAVLPRLEETFTPYFNLSFCLDSQRRVSERRVSEECVRCVVPSQ